VASLPIAAKGGSGGPLTDSWTRVRAVGSTAYAVRGNGAQV